MNNKIYIVNSVQRDKTDDGAISHLVGMYDSLEKAVIARYKQIDNLTNYLNPSIDKTKWTNDLKFNKISNGKGFAVPKSYSYDDDNYYLSVDIEKRTLNSTKIFVI